MTSLYEVLKAQKMGAAISPDYFTALWAGYTGGGGWEVLEYTGAVPVEITANGEPLIELLISGNMQQSGTPTSTTPIQPQECGERTGNLANLYGVDTTILGLHYTVGENMSIVINGTKGNGANVHSLVYPNITLPAGTYTVKVKMVSGSITDLTTDDGLFFGINQSTYGQRTTPGVKQVGDVGKRTFTLANDTLLSSIDIAPSYGSQGSVWTNATFECWFYAGSDDKPFEPYGYKLDISSGGENLFDTFTIVGKVPSVNNGNLVNSVNGATTEMIPISNPLLTMSYNQSMARYFFLYDSQGVFIGYKQGGKAGANCTNEISGYENAKYMRIRVDNLSTYLANPKLMLNLGSTAKPYSPYNRTTTPVYLGEVESTRVIKKLVLDGTETGWNINNDAEKTNTIYTYITLTNNDSSSAAVCTHYYYKNVYSVDEQGFHYFQTSFRFRTDKSIASSLDDFKAYLAQQYANGTPVCVWYVLAEPTTGIHNEPLRKIGNYADTLSVPQTIPTVEGENLIDVETTLKPSEIYLKYKGRSNS